MIAEIALAFIAGMFIGLLIGIKTIFKIKREYIKDGYLIHDSQLYSVEKYKP